MLLLSHLLLKMQYFEPWKIAILLKSSLRSLQTVIEQPRKRKVFHPNPPTATMYLKDEREDMYASEVRNLRNVSYKTSSKETEVFVFKCWPLLNTTSRRALRRTRKKWGWPYVYKPRNDLIKRLSEQLGMTKEEVLIQLYKERNYLLSFDEHRPPRKPSRRK